METSQPRKTSRTVQAAVFTAVVLAAISATVSSAGTVYDGGKALRQNCARGAPTGANGETYTDENGGKWQYLLADDDLATSTTSFGKSVSSGDYRGIGGNSSRTGAPFIHVNMTGEATMDGVTDGATVPAEPVDPDEFYIHPGAPSSGYHYVVLRFIVPEDGWYSAFLTAHDLNGGGSATDQAGAEVRFLAGGVFQAHGVVALENYTGTTSCGGILTRRFDFQMPVRWMTAGETLDFMVGANGNHANDATGLKAFVTKEKAGAFYDAGLAMANDMTNSSLNPFGTDALGMWYYFSVDASSTSVAGFPAWAPGNLTRKGVARLLTSYDRNDATKGFRMSTADTLPYLCVNVSTANAADIAPQELITHPCSDLTRWTALRFRPPRSGIYSASILLRDIARATGAAAANADGVMAYLLVSEKLVTNKVVAAENANATAHFTFGPRLVAANEPIDIVISPYNNYASDGTGISAIFRREADVYDAGPSLAALDWANTTKPAHPFADALGDGATWDIGSSASAGGTFATMPYAFMKVSNGIDYFGYGAASDGGLPRVMVATNRIVNLYSNTSPDNNDFFKMAPNELWAHPNSSGSGTKCPVVRAAVPADGVYHARAYVRDISKYQNTIDGVRLNILAGGYVAATEIVSIDKDTSNTYPREAVLDGDRLWLKTGVALDAALDPMGNNTSDGTGMSVCYVLEGEETPHVINLDITGASDSTGRFSAHTGIGREGWLDWNKWNALRPDSTATAMVDECFEADGATRRNAIVTLTHDSDAAVATVAGGGASTLLNNYVSSSGTSDTYTFTIEKLKKNEPYTLWLYSAKGNATGNATFTVGGVTKGVEQTWSLGSTKMLTRFDVMSDASGVITGTFAAADGNGGAFNGLTIVGDFPDYRSPAFMMIVR